MSKKCKHSLIINNLFIVVFAFLLILNLWKSFFGFCSTDESFIITSALRFVQGDALIVDEWHPAQFSTLLIAPFISIFLKLHNSAEGIVLFSRFLFVFIQFSSSLFIYRRLKTFGSLRIVCVAIYLLFSKDGIMISNYNTIGLMSVIVSSLLILLPVHKSDSFFAGVFYAIAIICTPHMILLYIVISVWLLIYSTIHKNTILSHKTKWVSFTLGISLIILIFLCFIFSRSSARSVIGSIPYLFNSDPAHKPLGLGPIIQTLALFKMVWLNSTITKIIVPIYALLILIVVFYKKSRDNHWLLTLLIFLSCMLVIGYGAIDYRSFCFISFIPIGFVLPYFFPQISHKLQLFYWVGIVYLFMINLSSDTVISAANNAALICAMSTILMLSKVTLSKSYEIGKSLLISLLIFMLIYQKVFVIYRDNPTSTLHSLISSGCAKGIITTSENSEAYNEYLQTLTNWELDPGEKVFIFTNQAWMYLELPNQRIATFSTWYKPYRPYFFQQELQYYTMNPSQTPTSIYFPIVNDSFREYIDILIKKYSYSESSYDNGIILSK